MAAWPAWEAAFCASAAACLGAAGALASTFAAAAGGAGTGLAEYRQQAAFEVRAEVHCGFQPMSSHSLEAETGWNMLGHLSPRGIVGVQKENKQSVPRSPSFAASFASDGFGASGASAVAFAATAGTHNASTPCARGTSCTVGAEYPCNLVIEQRLVLVPRKSGPMRRVLVSIPLAQLSLNHWAHRPLRRPLPQRILAPLVPLPSPLPPLQVAHTVLQRVVQEGTCLSNGAASRQNCARQAPGLSARLYTWIAENVR